MTSFYRNSPPGESAANFNRIRKLIFVAFGGLSVSIIVLVLIGGWLVAFLYDDRYLEAGVMLVTLTSMHILQIHQIPYQHAVLGLGSSRQYFTLIAVKALAMISCIWLGLEFFGLLGGIIGQGVAFVISYPASLFYAIRMKVWDPLFDIFLFAVAAVITSTAWFLYSDQMQSLIGY
jgi:O-antigen/teichoic acid export membrane protein